MCQECNKWCPDALQLAAAQAELSMHAQFRQLQEVPGTCGSSAGCLTLKEMRTVKCASMDDACVIWTGLITPVYTMASCLDRGHSVPTGGLINESS